MAQQKPTMESTLLETPYHKESLDRMQGKKMVSLISTSQWYLMQGSKAQEGKAAAFLCNRAPESSEGS